MKNLEQIVKELSERALKEDQERQRAEVIKVLSALYDKAAAYTNIIMAVGYAGFFTVWSHMKVYMAALDMRVSALCMLTSVTVFVIWEVAKMILTAGSFHGIQNVLKAPPSEFRSRLAAQEQAERVNYVRIMRWWPLVLFLSIVPALVATCILIVSFIINL